MSGTLPHRAMRRLAGAAGALAARLDRRGTGEAEAALARALPELGAGERRALARESRARRWIARWDARALGRLDAVALCARLRLEGWDRPEEAAAGEPAPVYVAAPLGAPEVVVRALAIYRAPLTIAPGPGTGSGGPRRPRERSAGRVLSTPEAVERWLARGAEGALLAAADAPGDTVEAPLLGGRVALAELPFRVAAGRGARLVPIVGEPRPGGGWAVRVLPSVPPRAGGAEDLAARWAERLEPVVRHDAAAWPWSEPRWRPGP